MKMKAYPKYKKSGVEWLGEVPEHWVAWPFRRIIAQIKDGTHGTFERTSEGHPLLSAKNVSNNHIIISDNESLISEDDYHAIVGNGFPRKGDLLLTIVGTIGRVLVYDKDDPLAFQRSVCFIRLARDISQSFYKYFIISKYFQEQLITYSKVSAQGGIYMGDVLKCAVITPPLPEQLSIAAYLDRETGRIDSLIDKKQRIVKLLKEQRIALISHAVTKGLDPNVKMKLSGVEWLGEVPEHWEIKRTRYKVLMNPSKREISGLPLETEVPFLPMEAVGDNGSLTLELTRPIAEVTTGYTFFSEGDVSFAKITPCFENGKGAIMQNLSTKFGFGTTELTVLRPGKTINNKYLYYLTISPEFRKNGEAWMYGAGGQKRVPDDFVREFIFSWPPLPEQRSIATYLDRETGRIDSLIEKVEKAIDILKEHRTALISAAVTGKIDVREAA